MRNTIIELDALFIERGKTTEFDRSVTIANNIEVCMSKWYVYKLAFQEFCEIELNFTRTNEYFGIFTNGDEFVFKVERKLN